MRLRQRNAMSSRPARVNRSRLFLESKTNKREQQWQSSNKTTKPVEQNFLDNLNKKGDGEQSPIPG